MKRNRRVFAVATGFVVLVLLVLSAWIGLEHRQDQLDQRLLRALKKRDTALAVRLLDEGASANALDQPSPPGGWRHTLEGLKSRILNRPIPEEQTPYAPAITLVYPDTLALTLPSGRPAEDLPLVRALVEHDADVNAWNNRGFTLLHKAALAKHVETARYLLEHGANPNAQTDQGYVPLDWSNPEIAALLLKHGADVNHRNEINEYGDTPLVSAVARYDIPLATVLLGAHAEVNSHNNLGMTPLHFALFGTAHSPPSERPKRAMMARLLLLHGARANIRDGEGRTALDDARRDKLRDLIPLLEQAARRENAGKR